MLAIFLEERGRGVRGVPSKFPPYVVTPQPELIGRKLELARIDALLESSLLGRIDRLALVGEAGIGKSILLEHTAARATGMTIVSATGVQSETDLAFSGLLELLRPLLGEFVQLVEAQKATLRGALGLEPPHQGARFAVGTAVLSLLAAAAETRPLLVLLDDVQWLDKPSQQALAFAIRRLGADRVAVLAAARPRGLGALEEARFEVHLLAGLDDAEAMSLVRLSLGREPAPDVARQILETAGGNPLGLVELPKLLSEAQLTGRAPLPETLPTGDAIERSFASEIESLPPAARLALLAAAALSSHNVDELAPALSALGLNAGELAPAETAGLLTVQANRLSFRHPLVRSAVLSRAPHPELRRVHAALAGQMPAGERRARHLAAATYEPDESVALELELAARGVLDRRGPAAAISLLLRAAELSAGPDERARRLVAGAEAAWLGGLTSEAAELAKQAQALSRDVVTRADALHLLGQIAHQTAPPRVAQVHLLAAAGLVENIDAHRTVRILTDAFTSFLYAGAPPAALAMARRIERALPETSDLVDAFFASHCLGVGLIANGHTDAGEPHVRRALDLIQKVDWLRSDPRHMSMTAMDAAWVNDLALAEELSEKAIAIARADGLLTALPALLKFSAWAAFDTGRWQAAYATAGEAVRLAEETGQTAQRCSCLGILLAVDALTGRAEAAYRHGAAAMALADELELPWHRAGFARSLGLLELGLGHNARAVQHLRAAQDLLDAGGFRNESAAPDLIEALVRSQGRQAVGDLVDKLAELASTNTSLDPAVHRCRGLVADDDAFADFFQMAIGAPQDEPFSLARTHLCFGERLRRVGLRREARAQLEAALRVFLQLGAEPWAARAEAELVASGRKLRPRGPEGWTDLTPQEIQVGIQVARGLSNREIAQTLFLSPKTIESHLTRIYRKLGMHARAELAARFASQLSEKSAKAGHEAGGWGAQGA
jgi:DNA-binding CsgD family transcriptional regulator